MSHIDKEKRAKARAETRKLVRESIAKGDEYAWNRDLYSRAGRKAENIPWADLVPNPNLSEWLEKIAIKGSGKSAIVIGCGLGDDSEELRRRGFAVTAFDVAEPAIEWCKERFPDSAVQYVVGDLFSPPPGWTGRFDFVLESYTLQTFPPSLRGRAMRAIAALVAPGGTLLVIARGRDVSEPEGEFPWPLTRTEFDVFRELGLREQSFEEYFDREDPPVKRFRCSWLRP